MNEIEAIKGHLEQYKAIVARQTDRLYNALEELQRTTLMLFEQKVSNQKIDTWQQKEGFSVDENGFFQSLPLLLAFRANKAPLDAISFSWDGQQRNNPTARHHMYCHRNIGAHLKHIHDRLGDVGWIYYQDASNTALQYPYIDQCTAITSDFDWSTYHTYVSVCPENNQHQHIQWTPPSIDYAGEGLILSVSIPVWQEDLFLGLWSIDLPIRYLYRDFASTKAFPNQDQFIVNSEGLLVLHENLQAEVDQAKGQILLHPLAKLGGQWAQLELDSVLSKNSGTITVRDKNQVDWLYCYCRVPGVDWVFFSGMPKLFMEEAASKRLSQAFQQIAQGNYTYRIDSPSTGALPTLVEEFNKMTRRLGQAEKHRKKIEHQLRTAQKMEAVGRLAGGVAHDYNNMTSVIMGYTELLLEQITESDPFYFELQEIAKAAHRSMELTRQLLAFARRQAIAPVVLDINDAVKNMLNMLHRLIGEDIDLSYHPGNDIWPIQIDPSQIDQILANLCVNSRDAIRGVGSIIIETGNVVLDEEYCSLHRGFRPGKFVQLTVSDTGTGIDADVLDNIFEPFFTTKPLGQGTGLGLATIYGITKQNHGFINVYSELGHGTTFKIYLPKISGETVELITVNDKEIPLGKNETILLVEDETAILKLAERMLQKLNFQVLPSNSSLNAINIAKENIGKIDLLITDVVMPEMNGNDLARQLQEFLPNLKILYISGYTSNVIVHRGVLDKDVVLLQKPFTQRELASKVRQVLDQT